VIQCIATIVTTRGYYSLSHIAVNIQCNSSKKDIIQWQRYVSSKTCLPQDH